MLVFFDDILIYRNTWEEHLKHVDQALQLFKDHQLYDKSSKYFLVLRRWIIWDRVSHEGVKVDPNKIKAIMERSIPKTIKKLRGFLGLTGYYRRFVRNYDRIVAPLQLY